MTSLLLGTQAAGFLLGTNWFLVLSSALSSRSEFFGQLCKVLVHGRGHGHIAQNGAQLYQTPTVGAWMEERDKPWNWMPACSVCKRQKKVCECGTGWRPEPGRGSQASAPGSVFCLTAFSPQLQLSEILISSSNGY